MDDAEMLPVTIVTGLDVVTAAAGAAARLDFDRRALEARPEERGELAVEDSPRRRIGDGEGRMGGGGTERRVRAGRNAASAPCDRAPRAARAICGESRRARPAP